MKHLIALGLLVGSLLLAGCESGVVVARRSYRDVDVDRVYHRDPYYHDRRVVRRSYAYYPPRYRTYSSNPMHLPASDPDDYPDDYRDVRRVRVVRRY